MISYGGSSPWKSILQMKDDMPKFTVKLPDKLPLLSENVVDFI